MTVENGDIVKAAFELEYPDGTIGQNVYFFQSVFTSGRLESAVLSAVKTYVEDIYDAVAAYVSSTMTINPCEVDVVEFDDTEGIWKVVAQVGSTTPAITFTGSGGVLPNQIAGIIRANTLRPKSYGKKFLMGFVEAAASGSDLESAVVTALATSLASYLADETVVGDDVLSPGVIRTGVDTFLQFTDGVVNSIVGTQRRRKPGVGA